MDDDRQPTASVHARKTSRPTTTAMSRRLATHVRRLRDSRGDDADGSLRIAAERLDAYAAAMTGRPTDAQPAVPLSVALSIETLGALKREAELAGTTLTEIVHRAIERMLDRPDATDRPDRRQPCPTRASFRIRAETLARVDAKADEERTSPSDFVRRAIDALVLRPASARTAGNGPMEGPFTESDRSGKGDAWEG